MLSAKDLGEKLKLKSFEINHLLENIGFVKKTETGYICLNDNLCLTRYSKEKNYTYVVWQESILQNLLFQKALDNYSNETFNIENTGIFKFDRNFFKADFRTMDGHYVRSKSEVIIDNWLYMNGFVHAYEKRVPIEEELYSDFYIPQENVYIEFWGLNDNPKYIKHREEKIKLYKKYDFNLLELTENDVKDIDDILPLKLMKFNIKVR